MLVPPHHPLHEEGPGQAEDEQVPEAGAMRYVEVTGFNGQENTNFGKGKILLHSALHHPVARITKLIVA
jgi:hypothetical protein